MSHIRLLSPDFWTWEAVIDCTPMSRLLFLGLQNFADDFGVLPLRPRTLRLQIFPGDALDDEAVRVLIEELAARGLVRRYTVEDVEYLSIVDWAVHQRVAKRARRRYPAPAPDHGEPHSNPSQVPEPVAAEPPPPAPEAAACDAAAATPDHSNPSQSPELAAEDPPPAREAAACAATVTTADHSNPSQSPEPVAAANDDAADAAWHHAVASAVRRSWGADLPADLPLHAARWRAEGRDLARDVLPAVRRVVRAAVELNRPLRLALADAAMANHVKRAPA
ncbi:MAG: hypothetical protein KF889_20270 [Alphaproteobacteria bacterium]|nr:hypothetical protein [Alphaproteobacteria bacterium]MCW5744192.1 hypothetical protein [Alphaproteobacteria bacterium]